MARYLLKDKKSGKPRHVALTDVAVDFFALVVKNRNANDLMLTLSGHKWKLSDQTNRMRKACIAAGVEHAGIQFCDILMPLMQS